MATGKLAKVMSAAGNPTPVYVVSANATYGTLTIDLDNTADIPTDGSNQDATVAVYIADGATFAPVDRIGFAIIPPGGHFNIGCGLVSPGEHVIVVSDKGTVAIRLTGLEEIPVTTP